MARERWKWVLGFVCLLLIILVFYFSGLLLEKIRQEEEKKVKLWAGAIQKKSELLREAGKLFSEITEEEKIKATIYARATEALAHNASPSGIEFLLFVLQNNQTVPVILTDSKNKIVAFRNLDSARTSDTAYLYSELREMKKKYPPIRLKLYKGLEQFLYYKDSRILTRSRSIMDTLVNSYLQEVARNSIQVEVLWMGEDNRVIAYNAPDSSSQPQQTEKILLRLSKQNPPIEITLPDGSKSHIYYASSSILSYIRYFPYLFSVVFVLILILTIFFYSSSYRLEQDRLWVGMSKETAHQLGTPISSLMGWVDLLEDKISDERIMSSMKEDLKRLKMITQRFSKIGSKPELKESSLTALVNNFTEYIQHRISKNIRIHTRVPDKEIFIPMSAELMEWVLENLIKNAVDAMQGHGNIYITLEEKPETIILKVADEGKGIPPNLRKKIFKPGFSTKSRGWGLGLSLSKRIIEEYHDGKLYVEKQLPDKGAVFCIELKS
ncbi:MAG: HAMP domain-containing histidine kinase [Bacteroidia bacterium]|nr:HAMP domain-containing histidine kinase [Bacteroidia bacterium]